MKHRSKTAKKRFGLYVVVFTCIIISACQGKPNQEVVVGKKDESFDLATANSSGKKNDIDAAQQIVTNEVFTSTDGSVELTFCINQSLTAADMPIVKVAPHFLTEDDAKRAAQALYGDNALFWEAEPAMNMRYSKEEIQQQIARWSPYTTEAAARELFGDQSGDLQDDADTIRSYMEYLTLSVYPNAPSGDFREKCHWTFQSSSHYFYGTENPENADTENENREIQAWTKVGDFFYSFQAATRNKNDYKLNNIYADPVYDAPLYIDYELLKAEKLRTDSPTENQIEAVQNKAQSILDRMGLGDWKVDQAAVEEVRDGDAMEYTINVGAVPVFEGVPAVRRMQLNDLKSKAACASNYYLTDANFSFSANGDMISFSLFSPVDVQEIVDERVSTVPVEELLMRIKDQLSLSDYYSYGFGEVADTISEPVLCKVELSSLEYGLTRAKAPNTDESYYYLPALHVKGYVDYVGKDSGSLYFSTRDEEQTLLIVNAVDGSVINIINE